MQRVLRLVAKRRQFVSPSNNVTAMLRDQHGLATGEVERFRIFPHQESPCLLSSEHRHQLQSRWWQRAPEFDFFETTSSLLLFLPMPFGREEGQLCNRQGQHV